MFKLFLKRIKTKAEHQLNEVSNDALINSVPKQHQQVVIDAIRRLDLRPNFNVKEDGLTLFHTVAEVFFPIDFIASRIAGAHFEIRRVSDDSIVWCTGRSQKAQRIAKILTRPNCLQSWTEFVYSHIVNKLSTGNGFIRAAMSEIDDENTPKWKWCNNFWSVPTSEVSIQLANSVPMFGICDKEDIIKGYKIGDDNRIIPTWQVWHDRDNYTNLGAGTSSLLMSGSRLDVVGKVIATLQKVYSARNIIYSRCGALGLITNKTSDVTGHVAMTEKEKKELLEHYNKTYGVTEDKSPVMVTNSDLDYKQLGMSIEQLQPFEETLLDAIVIAGQFGIPDVLVPRKDHSTFNNQSTAEKGVYTGVIIPMAKRFCLELTEFLGIEPEGYYIDCNFDGVDCLQQGLKESEEVKSLINDRCRTQFNEGLISYNDWRAQIHESALEDAVFSKTKFEMTDEELNRINRIMNNNTNPQQNYGKDNDESASAD